MQLRGPSRRPFDSGKRFRPRRSIRATSARRLCAPSTMDHPPGAPAPSRRTARLETRGVRRRHPGPHDPGESPRAGLTREELRRGSGSPRRSSRSGRTPRPLRGSVDPLPRRRGPRPSPGGAPERAARRTRTSAAGVGRPHRSLSMRRAVLTLATSRSSSRLQHHHRDHKRGHASARRPTSGFIVNADVESTWTRVRSIVRG